MPLNISLTCFYKNDRANASKLSAIGMLWVLAMIYVQATECIFAFFRFFMMDINIKIIPNKKLR